MRVLDGQLHRGLNFLKEYLVQPCPSRRRRDAGPRATRTPHPQESARRAHRARRCRVHIRHRDDGDGLRDDGRRLLHSRGRGQSSWRGGLRDGAGYSSGSGAVVHGLGVCGGRRGGRRGRGVSHGHGAEGDGHGDGGQALAGAGALLDDGVGTNAARDGLDGDGAGGGLRGPNSGCGRGGSGGGDAGVVVRVNNVLGLENGVSMTTLATRIKVGGRKRARRRADVRHTQWQSWCA